MTLKLKFYLIVLHTLSIICMVLGWVLPIISINISVDLKLLSYTLLNESRSVFGTIEKLFSTGNWFPAMLILIFGIAIPVIKTITVYWLLIANQPLNRIHKIILNLSKWAMADVFALAILIAFLAANSLNQTQATFLSGFYFFSAFVIISVCASYLLQKYMQKNEL
jgi:uncharacterized paraquat-inducible protein A